MTNITSLDAARATNERFVAEPQEQVIRGENGRFTIDPATHSMRVFKLNIRRLTATWGYSAEGLLTNWFYDFDGWDELPEGIRETVDRLMLHCFNTTVISEEDLDLLIAHA